MNIVVVGFGKMGQLVKKTAEEHGHQVVMVVDITNCQDLDTLQEPVDCVIDFSHPDNLTWMLPYVKKSGAALVCGTTGLDDLQRKQIEALKDTNRVIYSANYSFGIAVFKEVLSMICLLYTSGLIAGAANIMIMYRIDITNIDVPASVASFFNGFNPLLAIQQNSKNTPNVANCTKRVSKLAYVSLSWNTIQLNAFNPPLPLLAIYVT